MKLLKETYKTATGAYKRAAFENSMAKSEYEHGYKAKYYRYRTIMVNGQWRVERIERIEQKDTV